LANVNTLTTDACIIPNLSNPIIEFFITLDPLYPLIPVPRLIDHPGLIHQKTQSHIERLFKNPIHHEVRNPSELGVSFALNPQPCICITYRVQLDIVWIQHHPSCLAVPINVHRIFN
jgi:hypothetical protein